MHIYMKHLHVQSAFNLKIKQLFDYDGQKN